MPKAPSPFFENNIPPEYVAVVLASSVGSRLFPITSADLPKHMMPVGGIPVISRLLTAIEASGFQEVVVVVAPEDKLTIPHLKSTLVKDVQQQQTDKSGNKFEIISNKPLVLESGDSKLKKITILTLNEDCQGSIDALRAVEEASVVPAASNIVVFPGDLVVFDKNVLSNLCDKHREGFRGLPNGSKSSKFKSACTVLLADAGEQDEHGIPLKESAKQKKGGLARDEEDIEYIALSYTSTLSAPRLILKQPKIDVHDIETSETPKLALPKPSLRVGGMTRVRTDWTDVHVYVLSPWVRRLTVERKSLITIQGDLLPLLISRQFKGIKATFGSKVEEQLVQEIIQTSPDLVLTDLAGPINDNDFTSSRSSSLAANKNLQEYACLAHVEDDAVRAVTVSSYLYANREILAQAFAPGGPPNDNDKNPCFGFPPNTSVRSKFHSILLQGATTGDKVTFKSASVGSNCKLGSKCRLNNVVIMNDVTIGDNVILQNSIVGNGCSIGDNCNFNDCQVAPGKSLPSGEKAKGESFA